jgi:GT2 family glycosyltransferase
MPAHVESFCGNLEWVVMVPGSNRGIAIVAIGRNEGERLKGCLRAAIQAAGSVVYVDSGSVDGSAAYARSMGCRVVELDPARPFTAARARNEGFACAVDHAPNAAFVQFVDGDCKLEEGWLEKGVAALAKRKDVALVRGHLREIHPDATVYNKLCDLEWRQTPGEIGACGGIFLARAEAFRAAGGFRPDVIAAEDDEFCVRVRRLGWKILMIDAPMARHDAAITRFSQWWQRTRRAGHAYAQVAALHGGGEERYFVRDRRRILLWGLALPAAALVLAPFTLGFSLSALICAYALQLLHIERGCRKRGWLRADARTYAFFTVISRFPALQGLLEYYWRQGRGRAMTIIEHKRSL